MTDVVLAHSTPLVSDVLVRALRLAGIDAQAGTAAEVDAVHVGEAPAEPAVVLPLDGSGPITSRHCIDDLVAAVRHVAAGRAVTSLAPQPTGTRPPLPRLTAREREVLALIADGRSNDAMGVELGISAHTVRTHVQNLLAKLGVDSRLAAAALARRSGLLPVLSR